MFFWGRLADNNWTRLVGIGMYSYVLVFGCHLEWKLRGRLDGVWVWNEGFKIIFGFNSRGSLIMNQMPP